MKKIFLFTATILLSVGLFAQADKGQTTPQKKEVKQTTETKSLTAPHKGAGEQQEFGIPGLTDEQRNSIKQLQLTMKEESLKNVNLLREKKAQLATLQKADKPDQEAIDKATEEITALQEEMTKARTDFRAKVNELLNDEQREEFQRSEPRKKDDPKSDKRSDKGKNVRGLQRDGKDANDRKLQPQDSKTTRETKDKNNKTATPVEKR